MAETHITMAAAAGRRRRVAYLKQVTKLLDAQIDQALVFLQTKHIDQPAVYHSISLTLGRYIETAITMKAIPSPSYIPKLLLIVKEVYIRKAGLPDSSLTTLLKHIKSACQVGWFSNEDKDCLLKMVDKASLGCHNLDKRQHSVSEIISRFYPKMRVEHILASFDVKAGEGPSEADFYISPNTVLDQNVWLLVARTDDIDTAACLISPSNVDFLINGSEVPNRTRKNKGKGPQLPTNVTKMVKDGVNNLRVVGEFDGAYVIVLALMSLISSLGSRLQDYVHPMFNDVESDCLVTGGPSRISLECPISGLRIRTPVKGHLCTHSQCFDYDFFIEANFMRPLWKCPLANCKRPICNLDVRIDQTFLKILNEAADDVGDVYVSDDGSWTVSLTEKSQINMDAMNQQNHVPGDTEIFVSLEANKTPAMSSLVWHDIGGSAINVPVECPSTVEQPSVTTPAVALEANVTPPTSSSALHDMRGSVIQCPSNFEQPTLIMPAVSLEANETPPMSSALHNMGGLVIKCPSTFEQPTVTTPVVSLEANETPPMSSSEQPPVTMPAASLEANETPPMSSALHNMGGLVIECPSTFEQANVTTTAVLLEANGTPPTPSSDQPTVTMPVVSLEANEAPPMSSALHNMGGLVIECPSTFAVNPPQVVKDSVLMPQSSCGTVYTPPLGQQTRPDVNPTATQVLARVQRQNSQTLTNQSTEADNYNHATQSSCDLVHKPPLAQQTRSDLNPPSSHLQAQSQPRNSQTQTDQSAEVDNGTCTSNQARRTSNRVRRTTLFTPVHLTPPSSAAPVLRKLDRRPPRTTDEAQGTTLVTPPIMKRGRKRKITTMPSVSTQEQGATLVTPVVKNKRGRKPKSTTDPAVGLNKRQVSPTQVHEVSRDEMLYVGMRGALTGKDREAAQLKYLAPPLQPIYADKPWPEPTTVVPVELLLMKQLNGRQPSDLPQ